MSARWSIDRRSLSRTAVRQAAASGISDAAEFLLEEANRTVPIEEHTLEGSGVASVDRGALKGAVSYDTPYAVVQHEHTEFHHNEGRRAKWLESTFKEQGLQALAHIAERIKAAV